MASGLIEEAYQRSEALLLQNGLEFGYQAAPANLVKPDYAWLFGRDGSLCALATLQHSNDGLRQRAKATLTSLRQVRSELGQVPFRADIRGGYRDFWYPGNLDSTLWWVVAALEMVRIEPDLKVSWQADIEQSVRWLRYQDVAEIGLLMQGQRSDWADEMPSHGAVLYSNALWLQVLQQYTKQFGFAFISREYVQQALHSFSAAFWPYEDSSITVENRAFTRAIEWAKTDLIKQPYFLQYLARRGYGYRCDVLGNILTLWFGLAGERSETVSDYLRSINVHTPYPGRSLYPAIYPGEAEWQTGMASRNQNLPHQYHNGGIWPFIGGLWVAQQAKQGVDEGVLLADLERLAAANALDGWAFNEYLHGEYGNPMGISGQSWNAATYIMAYEAVVQGRHTFTSTVVERQSYQLVEEPILQRQPLRFMAEGTTYD